MQISLGVPSMTSLPIKVLKRSVVKRVRATNFLVG